MVAKQLQQCLDDADGRDSFLAGYGTDTAVVTLADGLSQDVDGGSVTLLALLDLSVALAMVSF